jgi:hypothetical protein
MTALPEQGSQLRQGKKMTVSDPAPVYPLGGAGLFDVDPDQGTVNQDPKAVVTGDVAALPDDMEP